jgi:hypothetical protein
MVPVAKLPVLVRVMMAGQAGRLILMEITIIGPVAEEGLRLHNLRDI